MFGFFKRIRAFFAASASHGLITREIVMSVRIAVRDLEAQRIVLKDEHGTRWFYLESRDGIPQMAFEGPPGAFWCCAVLGSAPNGAAVNSQGLRCPWKHDARNTTFPPRLGPEWGRG